MRSSRSGRSITSSLVVTLALLAGGAVALAAPGTSRVSSLASEKAAIEASYDALRRAAPTRGPRAAGAQRPPAASTQEAWPAGIFDETEAPFPAGRYTILNRWQQDFGGHHVVIYAGALGTDAEQGVLVVMVYAMDSSSVSFHEIRSSGRQGALRIGSALGRVLTVRAATGAALTFDAEVGHFLP